jgi:hypothetical protein
VVSRIDAIHAAGHHGPAHIVFTGIIRQSRRGAPDDDGCRKSKLRFGQHFAISICHFFAPPFRGSEISTGRDIATHNFLIWNFPRRKYSWRGASA